MNRIYLNRRIVARALFAAAAGILILTVGIPYEVATGARRPRPAQFLYEEVPVPVKPGVRPVQGVDTPASAAKPVRSIFRFAVNTPVKDANGRTITGLGIKDFRAVTPTGADINYRVVKVEMIRDVSVAAHTRPQSIALLFDMSSSLLGTDPLGQRVDAAIKFVKSLPAGTRVALVTFSGLDALTGSTVKERMAFTEDKESVARAIEKLKNNVGGGTPLFAGLQFTLRSAVAELGARDRHVICFTDGDADLDDRSLRGTVEQEAVQAGVKIHFIALGATTSWNDIRSVAEKTGGRLEECKSAGMLDKSFEEMTRAVSDHSYYRVVLEAAQGRPFVPGDNLTVQLSSTHPGQEAVGRNAQFGIRVP